MVLKMMWSRLEGDVEAVDRAEGGEGSGTGPGPAFEATWADVAVADEGEEGGKESDNDAKVEENDEGESERETRENPAVLRMIWSLVKGDAEAIGVAEESAGDGPGMVPGPAFEAARDVADEGGKESDSAEIGGRDEIESERQARERAAALRMMWSGLEGDAEAVDVAEEGEGEGRGRPASEAASTTAARDPSDAERPSVDQVEMDDADEAQWKIFTTDVVSDGNLLPASQGDIDVGSPFPSTELDADSSDGPERQPLEELQQRYKSLLSLLLLHHV
ncbi:hypothetical protein DFH07DRAFT_862249 [Mycena maculata]|uniref:Uncharacterized protein n=1 Tax=Mycena maculata TaxID=230809 RepID=A0AAD7HBB9_9AGAR|nr:hypothetical protein DFH07DRAFT_862249 [Mycena maculata]